MKICIPTMGSGGLQEAVCQHFGQAPTFTLVDLENRDIKILPNVSEHMGGKGLPTDAILAEGVHVMIVGGLGPRAVSAFEKSGVEVFVGAAGTVQDAIDDWRDEMLSRASVENACKDHRH